jgi:hypothetical protein
MKARRVIRTSDNLVSLYSELGNRPHPFTVTIERGEERARTLDQNALQFKWATEIACQRGDVEPIEVQHEFKLDIGVPILREDDAVFNGFCGKVLDPLTREQQIKSMKYIAISSVMTVKQMSRFMDQIQRTYSQEGFRLTQPEEQV